MKRKKAMAIGAAAVMIVLGAVILIYRNKQWDSISVYCGLNQEEVVLTAREKAELSELVWNFDSAESKNYDSAQKTNVYGGIYITIQATSGDVIHKWTITDILIKHSVYKDGEEKESYFFERDEGFVGQVIDQITNLQRKRKQPPLPFSFSLNIVITYRIPLAALRGLGGAAF